jgi:two-component system, OmpR family, sensor kinase
VVIQQYTTTQYLRLADERVKEREDRLHGFNRAVTHEMKNRIGSAASAASLLRDPAVKSDAMELERLLSIVTTNVDGMNATLEQMRELSRLDPTPSQTRNVLLANVAAEVKRQLRDFAQDRGVTVELDDDMPRVEVPAAAFELALSNYLSNAIKYRDPDEDYPRVTVRASVTGEGADRELHVEVVDNGLGVPEDAREHLFERYYRAHAETVTGEEGSGLGLSLVRDNIAALGGRDVGGVLRQRVPLRLLGAAPRRGRAGPGRSLMGTPVGRDYSLTRSARGRRRSTERFWSMVSWSVQTQ